MSVYIVFYKNVTVLTIYYLIRLWQVIEKKIMSQIKQVTEVARWTMPEEIRDKLKVIVEYLEVEVRTKTLVHLL